MYSILNNNQIPCILRIQNSYILSIYHTYLNLFLCHWCFPFLSFILFGLFFLVSTLDLCYKKEIDSKIPYLLHLLDVIYCYLLSLSYIFFFSFYSPLILHLFHLFLSFLNYILHLRLPHLVLLHLRLVLLVCLVHFWYYPVQQGYIMNLLNIVHFMN